GVGMTPDRRRLAVEHERRTRIGAPTRHEHADTGRQLAQRLADLVLERLAILERLEGDRGLLVGQGPPARGAVPRTRLVLVTALAAPHQRPRFLAPADVSGVRFVSRVPTPGPPCNARLTLHPRSRVRAPAATARCARSG